MEPVKTRKTRNALIVVGVVFSLVLVAALWASAGLHSAPLGTLVKKDLPVLELELKFKDGKGNILPPEETRLADKVSEEPPPEGCPTLEGGDGVLMSEPSFEEKRKKDCPRRAAWTVRRHPVALSLYVRDGARLLGFLDKDPKAREVLASRFVRGLFTDLLLAASVRAEELHLDGLKGAFAEQLVREALKAHAELHYDVAHGAKGFVFSFVRDECPFAAKALPVICRVLVRSGYRVPKLGEPVFEMRIGVQRVFMTESRGRVYLANGLEGLLNVLESLEPPDDGQPKSALVATVRGEAFLGGVIQVMTGEPGWRVDFGIGIPGGNPGEVRMSAGKMVRGLRGPIFKGVFAGIPRDVFAGLAASLRLDPDLTDDQWGEMARGESGVESGQASGGNGEGGVALVWDISGRGKRSTALGMVIATPSNLEAAGRFTRYFSSSSETATCGGGTVFLAATSRDLLTRMKESCAGQSLSVLDWDRGGKKSEMESSQVFCFVNPGTALRELSLAGGASKSGDLEDFQPKWKREYEEAKNAMREDSEKVFRAFPVFAYAGSPAPGARSVLLRGFNVSEGAR